MTRRWHTVRVFISSTFRDFHSERDIITNRVFTELRAWCEQRFIHLVEIDLRWGVTLEESSTGKALEVCLDELDRSDFFVCLVGSRYGWIPESYQVGDGRRFDWVRHDKQGRSVTEMEICRAVLNDQSARALNISHAMFYIRDETFMKQVPLEYMSDFSDGAFSRKAGTPVFERDELKAQKIQALRSSVMNAGKQALKNPDPDLKIKVRENYPCHFAGTTRVAGVHADKPILQGLDQFMRHLIQDLKEAIEERYPIRKMIAESMTSELVQHRESTSNFMEHRTRNFQGREFAVRSILNYINAKSVNNGLFILSGEDGTGKTAVISKAFRQLSAEQRRKTKTAEQNSVQPDPLILVPFIAGAGPGSLQAQNMLRAMIQDIRNQLKAVRPREQVDARWSALKTTVKLSNQMDNMSKLSLFSSNRNQLGTGASEIAGEEEEMDLFDDEEEDRPNFNRSKSLRGRTGPQEFSGSFEKLVEFFKRTLTRACKHAKVVLVVDNISHMKMDENHVASLHWIPTTLPDNLRIVLTVDDQASPDWVQQVIQTCLKTTESSNDVLVSEEDNEESEPVNALVGSPTTPGASSNRNSRKSPPVQAHVRIGGLDRECAERLIVSHLHNYSKKLDSGQLDLLTAKAIDKSPTWLVLACEELRVFSLFEHVVDRIRNIPEDVPSLLDQLISRLELEHSPQFVQDALTLFIFARDGLYEHEVMSILGVAQRAWSLLFYNLKPFLHDTEGAASDEVIRFSHREWNKAISTRYKLHRPARAAKIHRRLAAYFLKQCYCKDNTGMFHWNSEKSRELWCLPFHLMHGGCFVELERVLTDLRFVEAKCTAGMHYEWVDDIARAISSVNDLTIRHLGRRSSVASTFLHRQAMAAAAATAATGMSTTTTPGGSNSTTTTTTHHSHVFPSQLEVSLIDNDEHDSDSECDEDQIPEFSIEQAQEMELRLHDFSSFAQAYAPDLGLYPHLVFQYAANYPDCTVVARTALLQYHESKPNELAVPQMCLNEADKNSADHTVHDSGDKRQADSWLQWINKPQETDPCLLTLKGHTGPVTCCAISTDDTFVASGSTDSTVRVWMVQTGELSQTLRGHGDAAITCVAFHPDDPFVLVTGARDGRIVTWNKGSKLFEFDGHSNGVVCCVSISEDAQTVVSGDDHGQVLVWDSMTGEILRDLKGFPTSSHVKHCCYSVDGTRVMATDSSKTVRGWNILSGEQFLCKTGEGLGIFQAGAMTPDSLQFIVRTSAMKLRLFASNVEPDESNDVDGHITLEQLKSTGVISEQPSFFGQSSSQFKSPAPAFISPNSYRGSITTATRTPIPGAATIAEEDSQNSSSLGNNGVIRFSRDTHLTSCIFEPEARFVNTCAMSRDDRISLACSDGTIRIFKARTGTKLCMLYGHSGEVLDLCYSSRGDRVVSASRDGTIRVWNPKRARMIKNVPHSTEILKCSFQPGFAHKVVSLSAEGEVSLWDTRSGKRKVISDKLVADPSTHRISAGVGIVDVEFTPSGRYLASQSTTLRIWELKQPDIRSKVPSSNQSTLSISGSNLDILGSFKEIPCVNAGVWAISPCERLVVLVEKNRNVITCWDVRSNPCKLTCELHAHTKAVSHLKFSKDGRFIFSSGHDGTVSVWDAIRAANRRDVQESGVCASNNVDNIYSRDFLLMSLNDPSAIGRSSIIHHCSESPNGRMLLTLSDGPGIKLWDFSKALAGVPFEACSSDLVAAADGSKTTAACFSPDGRTIASGSMNGWVRFWDTKLRALKGEMRAHISAIQGIRYFPDDRRVLSISEDYSLHVWDSHTKQCLNTMVFAASATSVELSYCGNFIVAGDACGDLRILKVVNRNRVGVLSGGQQREGVPIVTPLRRVLLTLRGSNKWDNKCRATCPYCATQFLVKGHTMEAIQKQVRNAMLYGESDEGYNSPHFVVRCDTCKGLLRCNPFLVDRMKVRRVHVMPALTDESFERVVMGEQGVARQSNFNSVQLGKAERGDQAVPNTETAAPNLPNENLNRMESSDNDEEVAEDGQQHYNLGMLTSKELRRKATTSFYNSANTIAPFRSREGTLGHSKVDALHLAGPLPQPTSKSRAKTHKKRTASVNHRGSRSRLSTANTKGSRRRRSSTPLLEVRAPTSRAVQLLTPLATPVIASCQRPKTSSATFAPNSRKLGKDKPIERTRKKISKRQQKALRDVLTDSRSMRSISNGSWEVASLTPEQDDRVRAQTSCGPRGPRGILAPGTLPQNWLSALRSPGSDINLNCLVNTPQDFGCVKDQRYLGVEGPHLRATNTSSTVSAQVQRGVPFDALHMRSSRSDFRIAMNMFNIYHGVKLHNDAEKVDMKHGRQVQISPSVLNLGSIRDKGIYQVPLRILNLGSNGIKYRAAVEIEQQQDCAAWERGNLPVETNTIYPKKGCSAIPGIASILRIELKVVEYVKSIRGRVIISTDFGEVFSVPLSAIVLTETDFEACSQNAATTNGRSITNPSVTLMGRVGEYPNSRQNATDVSDDNGAVGSSSSATDTVHATSQN